MKHFARLYKCLGFVVAIGIGAAMAPPGAGAQMRESVQLLQEPSPLLLGVSSQGYLGVDLVDVDQQKAQELKLKEVRGAIITLIDHDAPAGQIGLKINDVVLQLNGQAIEGADQLRRMLREMPAGRKVSLEISRDGNIETLAVELADRRVMEHDVWNRLDTGSEMFAQPPGMGMLAGGGGDAPTTGGFHMPFFGSSLNVGALVEPLTSQMAEYLGVPGGLMVKQVVRKSEAAAAGLKAFDVILKVDSDPIATLADWERSLHANQGKPVQVTVLRDRKQQTLTLQVDSKHHSELEIEDIFPAVDCRQVAAEIGPDFPQECIWDDAQALLGLPWQAMAELEAPHFEMTPQQAEELRKQAEKLRDSFNAGDFKLDQKQMEQLKQQMEEFRKNFNAGDLKLDPKQMDELRRQMEQWKRRMEEMKAPSLGGQV